MDIYWLKSVNSGKNFEKKYYYYKYTRATHKSKKYCDSRNLEAAESETFIEKLISHIAADSKFINAVYQQLDDNSHVGLKTEKEELVSLTTNHSRLEREEQNVSPIANIEKKK
jgi:hypothetical protein